MKAVPLMLLACVWAVAMAAPVQISPAAPVGEQDGLSLLQRAFQVKEKSELGEADLAVEEESDDKPLADKSTTTTIQCDKPAQCVLDLNSVTQNDLDGGEGAIRFSKVCIADGKSLDLVVTASEGYSGKTWKNGGGKFGQINMWTGKEATFTFSFYASGTNNAAKVKSMDLTFYDLDGDRSWGGKGWLERLTFTGYASYALHVNSLLHRKVRKGNATFTSTQEIVPNPIGARRLGPIHLKNSVQVRYESVSSFTATFSIIPAKKGKGNVHNRKLFFAGVAALTESCTATVCTSSQHQCSMSFSQAKLVRNNLGGAGPDTGAAELRYGSVCDVGGSVLDLVVTALSPYSPKDTKQNGVSGLYGNINVLVGTKVELKFQFVKNGTSTPVTLPSTDLTVFDLDGLPGIHEFVEASGYSSSTLGENSTVTQKVLSTSPSKSSFTSTAIGDASDNPTDPLALTPLQESRSVSLQYTKVNDFTMTFGSTGTSRYGRNYVFAGKSSINQRMCTSSQYENE